MKELSSRERIIKTLNHQEPDRVPIDIGGCSANLIHENAYKNLVEYLKIKNPEIKIQSLMIGAVYIDNRISNRLRSDVTGIHPGKTDNWKLELDTTNDSWNDEWGIHYKRHKSTMNYEWESHPLESINNIIDLKNYKWPDPRDPGRYRNLRDKAKDIFENSDKAIIVQQAFGIWEHYYSLRGYENAFIDLATNKKFVKYLTEKLTEWLIIYYENILNLVGSYVQIVKINDDLGSTNGPLISLKTYREIFKPGHEKIIKAIKKKTKAKILIHSDGSIYEFLPDFIEIGIDIVNPVEITAKDMKPSILKKEFGEDISFWGGGCSNKILEFGTPEDVENEVKRNIMEFAPGGGYVFGTIQNIQPFVPPQNIVKFFDAAYKYGKYPISL